MVGKGIANPSGLMLSVAMLMEWLGTRHKETAFIDASRAIELALDAALADARARTPDLGGNGTTKTFAQAVTARVDAGELRATGTR
jgi:3-isopropylmalate dehydrogenase